MPEFTILTVYAAQPEFEDLLVLQARHLASVCGNADFKVLAVPLEIADATQREIQQSLPVQWVQYPTGQFPCGKAQHGYLLDMLFSLATSSRTDWICTMDPDAFPLRCDWTTEVQRLFAGGTDIIAPLRIENNDTCLPHPCFCCVRAEAFRRCTISFLPTPNLPNYRLHVQQAADVGIRLAELVWQGQLVWSILRRSNLRNCHYLLGGCYGSLVFHLGALARSSLIFRGDLVRHRRLRAYYAVRRVLGDMPADALGGRCIDALLGFPRSRVARANRAAFEDLVQALRRDLSPLLAELGGGFIR